MNTYAYILCTVGIPMILAPGSSPVWPLTWLCVKELLDCQIHVQELLALLFTIYSVHNIFVQSQGTRSVIG